jgi:hypothetical protein
MPYFVNRRSGRYDDTFYEFNNKQEALDMASRLQPSEHGRAFYYVSSTCKDNWLE